MCRKMCPQATRPGVKLAARNCEFRDQTLNMVRDKLVLNYPDQIDKQGMKIETDISLNNMKWNGVKLALMLESIQSNSRTIDNNKLKFTCYRNKFKKVKDAAITQFFSNKFRLYEKSCKKTWDLINHLMNRGSRHSLPCAFFITNGQILTSPKEIANSFNAYFSNIGNELAKKITPNNLDFRTYLKGSVPNSMFLSPVTSEEIISIFSKL